MRQNNLEISQIHEIMAEIVQSLECLYILVDALNETPQSQALVAALTELCQEYPQIRVLVTCTTKPQDKSPLIKERTMKTGSVDHDIELYVQHRLSTEPSLRALSPKIQAEIKSKILSGADGM